MKKTIFFILIFFTSLNCQTPSDSLYRIELNLTASPIVSFFRNERMPGVENNASFGYGFSLRGMWHPSRLLSVGLMSGYLLIADDEIPQLSNSAIQGSYEPFASLSAIPLQVAISMQKDEFELGLGIGPYLLLSKIEGGIGADAKGRRIEFGITFFSSYSFIISERIKFGPELRILYFGYRGILSWMPSLNFRFEPYRY